MLLLLFFAPAVTFLQNQVNVELLDESTVGEYDFVFQVEATREQVVDLFHRTSRELESADKTLKEIEVYEDYGDRWIVRHRYAVGFAFFKDYTDMVLSFKSEHMDDYDIVSWTLYDSLDGKILADDGHYRISDAGEGTVRIEYYSRTEYASRRPVVAFALRNFSEPLLKSAMNRMFGQLDGDSGDFAERQSSS